jgi:hypothetical protein
MHEFGEIGWMGVIAGTVVAFLVGWAWYHEKVFGTRWAQGSRVELGSAASMPVFAMGTQLVGLGVLSLVVGITAQFEMLITAILSILAVAVLVVSNGAFVKKSQAALAIDFFYIVVAGAVMIGAQGIF